MRPRPSSASSSSSSQPSLACNSSLSASSNMEENSPSNNNKATPATTNNQKRQNSNVRATPVAVAAKRDALERSCWSWTSEIDDPESDIGMSEVRRAYKLHFPTHHPIVQRCKRNCRFNPRCFCALGELQWLGDASGSSTDEEAHSEDLVDDLETTMSLEQRQPQIPAGLRNLGNTCYVNSFLQIWFHNVTFRRALYEWEPGNDEEECENETLLEAENYKPRGKVASLQALFAMMEFTNRRAADPNDFIAKLGLDPQVQQDAQEFSKLFMSLLESSLSSQKNTFVQTMVQNQFMGKYAYVTKCCKCKKENRTPSAFYELDLTLQGNKTLSDCLADFTKEEKLQGDNQYLCSRCDSKQNAVRSTKLLDLPPVLNLQLNRFIFDMQTGRKKKLNSAVMFPEELDVSQYLGADLDEEDDGESDGSAKKGKKKNGKAKKKTVYQLTGVLMHVGAEANHGHYIAHIQEASTGQWFKFSDTLVEAISGKNPKLGAEVDPMITAKAAAKNGGAAAGKKIPKGFQSSNNAYMLVYTEKETLEQLRRQEEEKADRRKIVQRRAAKKRVREEKLEVRRKRRREAEKQKALEAEEEEEEKAEVKKEVKEVELEIAQSHNSCSEGEMETGESSAETADGDNNCRRRSSRRNGKETPPVKKEEKAAPSNGRLSQSSSEEALTTTTGTSGSSANDSDSGSDGEDVKDYVFVNNLVYPVNFPIHLRAFIEQDRALLNDELQEILCDKEEKHHERLYLRRRMRELLRQMPFTEDGVLHGGEEMMMDEDEDELEEDDFEFIPTEWLMRYIKTPQAASVIETTNFLCVHGKLDLDKIGEVKMVTALVADQLYDEAGEGTGDRLTHEALCLMCVRNQCKKLKLTQSSTADAKLIIDWLKQGCEDDVPAFWAGKATLKKWRQLSRDQLNLEILEEADHFLEVQHERQKEIRRRSLLAQQQRHRPQHGASDEDDEDDTDEEEEEEEEEMEEEEECVTIQRRSNGRGGEKAVIKPVLTAKKRGRSISQESRTSSSSADSGATKKSSSSSVTPAPIDLAEVQSKLLKIGTNISFAKVPAAVTKPDSTPVTPTGESSKTPRGSRTNGRGLSQSPAVLTNGSAASPSSSSSSNNKKQSLSVIKNGNNGTKHKPITLDNGDLECNEIISRVSNTPRMPRVPLSLNEDESDAADVILCDSSSGTNGHRGSNGNGSPSRPEDAVIEPINNINNPVRFNDDIICEHGNLCHDVMKRRLVPAKVWNKLMYYFPEAKKFPRDAESCQICKAASSEQAQETDRLRELAQTQRQTLSDIFNERNRPSWAKSQLNKVFLISRSFVHQWREFARDPAKKEQITDLGNESLLCTHGGLVYPIRLDTESDKESVVYLTSEEEWQHLKNLFIVDHEISVTRNKISAVGSPTPSNLLESSPSVCTDCLDKRLEAEEQDRLRYTNVKVFVRRINPSDKNLPDPSDPEFSMDSAAATASPEPPNKKAKGNGVSISAAAAAALTNDVRRSGRRQKVRGEKEVLVSSTMLLRDFKVKLMDQFKVPPFDQNLFYDGKKLEDSSQTLGQLRVLPSSLIYLRADEPSGTNGGEGISTEEAEEHPPEEGFKGTGLLGGF